MAFERGGPALPSRAVAALSSADSAAAADGNARIIVAIGILGTARVVGVAGVGGRYGDRTTSRTADPIIITVRRAARGPAPSVKLCGFFAPDVSASGLLRAVHGRDGVVATAILFVLVPPGVAQRAGSRGAVSSASP